MKQTSKSVTAWAPLRQPVFRALWIATIVSNVGTWMHITATAWLMTSLAPSTVMVALVQTATSLPIFLFALPAGVLADVLDRRRLILATQTWMAVAAATLGGLTLAGLTTPWLLLGLTLMLGLGAALNAPAWQAIVPELVRRNELMAAVALNSAGFNVARAIGPALGGLIIGIIGAGGTFLLNAGSFFGVLLVVFLWRRPPATSTLPAERMLGAMRAGLRYVRHAPALRAVFVRSAAFIVAGSALMALLPMFARRELAVTSLGYGFLVGSFGAGAVAAAGFVPTLRNRMSTDLFVVLGTLLFAGALTTMAFVHQFIIVCVTLAGGGAAWLALLSSFNSSAQAVLPSWVRGRAMAIYMLIFFGGLAGGSVLWGTAAAYIGIPRALLVAAGSLVAAFVLTARFKLSRAELLDLTPSMHWPSPAILVQPGPDDKPVLVMVEYRIDPDQADQFGMAMRRLRRTRLRDGALQWNLFVDSADPQRYVESFLVESWLEHLRQHERVTMADREIEREAAAFHKGEGLPRVTHFFAKSLPKGA